MPDTQLMEFWPEYGDAGPLWHPDGRSAELEGLGLPHALRERLVAWNADYADGKLPIGGQGDNEWLTEGRALLNAVRAALDGQYDVIVHEDWWAEPGLDVRRPK